jgi:hypothetical protein
VMESRDVMNVHVVEHSILNGIKYCTFWFRSIVEMTQHRLLQKKFAVDTVIFLPDFDEIKKANSRNSSVVFLDVKGAFDYVDK